MAESPEAVLNQYDEFGSPLVSGALSKTEVEILDLVSEGEIEGLVSGEYVLLGNTGEIGYRTSTFNLFTAPTGNSNLSYLRSIYWNQVPLINSNGRYNFQKIDISSTNGFPNGSVLSTFNKELTISRVIGERLFGTEYDQNNNPLDSKDFTKIYRILNPSCKAVIVNIKVNQLFKQVTVTEGVDVAGDIVTSSIDYTIYYRPIYSKPGKTPSSFTFGRRDTIQGKITAGYIKSSRVDFFKVTNPTDINDFLGWEIKIFRTTPESITSFVKNQTIIDSLTEIYSDVLTYPDSAIIRQKFDAQFFNQIPERAFDCNLLKVKVPSTYDPILRTYNETDQGWDGTFAEEKKWTNNPAWCFYDIVTNKRYGLGKYIDESSIDKWSLYEISKYCDILVEDGNGGIEPLFVCNLILNSRDEAYKVLNDMTSIFNAMLYYLNGVIYPVQDVRKSQNQIRTQFTNANVENGDFHYSSSSKKGRHTIAIVRFNDKNDFYKPAVEYVEDFDGIRKYGIRETELTAFGCTSRGQANRLGKWTLLTEILENEIISFVAGTEAILLRPGDVFKVFDSNRKTQRLGGRTYSINNGSNYCDVILDSQINLNTGTIYDISLLTPTYDLIPNATGIGSKTSILGTDSEGVDNLTSKDFQNFRRSYLQTFSFTGISGSSIDSNNRTIINLNQRLNDIDYSIDQNTIWTITLKSGINNSIDSRQFLDSGTDYYRVLRIEEKESNKYNVVGLQYAEQKYDGIITGLTTQRKRSTSSQANYSLIQNEGIASPTGLRLTLNNASKYTPKIDYSFSVPSYSNITSYKIYVNNQNFTDPGIPSETYLAANLPVDKTFDTFLPSVSGQYYFRVYSYNDFVSLISSNPATGSISVPTFSPIQDITISSLQLDPYSTGNAGAASNTGFYYNENPVFTWQVGRNYNAVQIHPFSYRVTVRQPSSTNVPSNVVYYEETGLSLGNDGLKFTFNFDKNLASSGGPYRNYDIVVEAQDRFYNTSAGNRLNPKIESWVNPNGFDILPVNNNRVTGFFLSTGDNVIISGFKTSEWIDAYGNIHINFISGSLNTGIKGGFVFYSTGLFTSNEVTGTNRLIINTGEFDYDFKNKLAKIPAQFYNIPTGYIALGFYDAFDNALKTRGFSSNRIVSGLYVSNVISVTATGALDVLNVTQKMRLQSSEGPTDRFSSLKLGLSGSYLVLKYTDENNNDFIVNSRITGAGGLSPSLLVDNQGNFLVDPSLNNLWDGTYF